MASVLVTGATGNAARDLPTLLLDRGHRVRVLVHTRPATGLDPRAETVTGDLTDADSLRAALAGVEEAFVVTVDDGAAAFAAAAAGTGLRRIVLLSSKAVDDTVFDGFDNPIYRKHVLAEEQIAGLGVTTTVLRPGGLASNALRWAPAIREQGRVGALFPQLAAPLLDPADLAAVAALILDAAPETHAGRVYTLTGPEVVTVTEQVEILAEELGRAIDLVELSEDEALTALARTLPPEFAAHYIPVQRRYLELEPVVFDTVPALLGRPGRKFREWVRANVSRFR